MIWAPKPIKERLRRQRGFIMNPFQFGGVHDPNFSNVVLLCHFDGTDGQGSTVDSSSFAKAITQSGGITLQTDQAKFGTSSSESFASGSRIWTCADSADWDFGSGQFTVEAWVYFTASPTTVHLVVSQRGTSSNLAFEFGQINGQLGFGYSTNGTSFTFVQAAWTPALNTWHHIAADRDASNTLRVYLNGAVHASGSAAVTFFNSTAQLNVCGSSVWFGIAGYVDEVRITKGVARYGGAFTHPTTAFPDS